MKKLSIAPCDPRPRRGISLVIVLGSLVFLSALVVAFLVQMTTELKSSRLYADEASARLLAQSATNIVMTQIKDGTKGDENGSPLAWASQPGMIRTYTDAGRPHQYFKLYSDDTMVGDGVFNPHTPDPDLATWSTNKALYTDLNQPVTVGTEKAYPIIDGNVVDMTLTSGGAVKTYNSDSDNSAPDIDGFYVKNAPVAASPSANPVPMPVKWLYVLANGEVVAPSRVSDRLVRVPGADQSPIVGRVAFWTDDESAKININTASEGVYWDTPRVKSRQEDVLKINQPMAGEYQRYPGHPAMTCLSTVIKHPSNWNPGTPVPTFKGGSNEAVSFTLCSPAQWIENQWAQKLYGIVPRVGSGGSNAGSVPTAMIATGTEPPVSLDADRLYASTDELLFRPTRTGNNSELGYPAQPEPQVLDKATIERAQFFLTANSRSPDVNLFNLPRVSIWPLHVEDTSHRTAFDRLIAFCSTMRNDLGANAYRYYFQRKDPNSPVADLPPNGGVTGLSRNRSLLEYLRTLANHNIPGFGGNFGAKYSLDKDQIFTEIFDYIRSTNLVDASIVTPANRYTSGIPGSAATQQWANRIGLGQVVPIVDEATTTRGFGRYPTVQGAAVLFIAQVDGDDPLVPRDPTTHVSVAPFPAMTSQVDPVTGMPLPTYTSNTATGTVVATAVAPGFVRVQAMFIPQFFTPSVGAPWIFPNFQYSVDTSQLTLNGAPLTFPNNTPGTIYTKNDSSLDETGFGDQLGLRQAVKIQGTKLASTMTDIPKGNSTLAGRVTIKIYPTGVSNPLQTFVLNFNGSPAFANPEVWDANKVGYNKVANRNNSGGFDHFTIHYVNYRSFSGSPRNYNPANPDQPLADTQGNRLTGLLSTRGAHGFITPLDAIRSVGVASGDTRLIAAQENPAETLFTPNPATDKVMGAHNFFSGYGHPYYGAALGRLAKGLAYSPSRSSTLNLQKNAPDAVSNILSIYSWQFTQASDIPLDGVAVGKSSDSTPSDIPGDWDNGPFAVRDGPFINKPDEGDRGRTSGERWEWQEPYLWQIKNAAGGTVSLSLFSPNRQIPSAVTFGSLPTGVKANRPWQTLLFRPEPGHPGSKDYDGSGVASPGMPADHLLLDLFHMPVVEPYAISEPMSTAGRINMNYQIVPFTYINRDTGIRALLKSEKVISIKDSLAPVYKCWEYKPQQAAIRLDVNADETLKGFERRFNPSLYGLSAEPDIFRSPSEICELYVVPVDDGTTNDTYESMAAYWSAADPVNGRRLTGDNSKERIYATLYPRLTTKSNTFTIHIRAQSLKKAHRSGAADQQLWDETVDQITGEYRGSQTVERFIDPNQRMTDPNDPPLPDYAAATDPTSSLPLSSFYRFRVVNTKQFAP